MSAPKPTHESESDETNADSRLPQPPRRIAIAQAAPVTGDLGSSLEKAASLCRQSAEEGAHLVVFPETWLGGYPAWLDICSDAALWNHPPVQEIHARLRRGSVPVPGPHTEELSRLAAELGLVIGIGVQEKVERGPGNRSLYNSFLLFDACGELRIHHRKLVPTYTEKLIWAPGDAHGLRAVDTAAGRVGGLICWEHWMPLARQVLHEDGEDIHLALWPTVKEIHQLASRHYAFEGRCFVVAAGSILPVADLPEGLELAGTDGDSTDSAAALALRGGSAVIGPDGEYVLEPVFDREALLICDLDLEAIDRHATTLDVSGHYARPDLLELRLERGAPRGGRAERSSEQRERRQSLGHGNAGGVERDGRESGPADFGDR